MVEFLPRFLKQKKSWLRFIPGGESGMCSFHASLYCLFSIRTCCFLFSNCKCKKEKLSPTTRKQLLGGWRRDWHLLTEELGQQPCRLWSGLPHAWVCRWCSWPLKNSWIPLLLLAGSLPHSIPQLTLCLWSFSSMWNAAKLRCFPGRANNTLEVELEQ